MKIIDNRIFICLDDSLKHHLKLEVDKQITPDVWINVCLKIWLRVDRQIIDQLRTQLRSLDDFSF